MINNVLGEIDYFLENGFSGSLEVVFGILEIQTLVKDKLLNTTIKKKGRIRIQKLNNDNLAQMEVLDNLVFEFAFLFTYSKSQNLYQSNLIEMPRPLNKGFLIIDKESIHLEFIIDSPDENAKVLVRHNYKNYIQMIKK